MNRSLFIFFILFTTNTYCQTLICGYVEWCTTTKTTTNQITVSLLYNDSIIQTGVVDSTGDFFIYSTLKLSDPILMLSYGRDTIKTKVVRTDTVSFPNYKEFYFWICAENMETVYALNTDWSVVVQRYASNRIYLYGSMIAEKREGDWFSFYEDGALWSKGNYKNGLRQGYAVTFFRNGQKSSEGNYKDDKPFGKWKYWDELGNMAEKDMGEK